MISITALKACFYKNSLKRLFIGEVVLSTDGVIGV